MDKNKEGKMSGNDNKSEKKSDSDKNNVPKNDSSRSDFRFGNDLDNISVGEMAYLVIKNLESRGFSTKNLDVSRIEKNIKAMIFKVTAPLTKNEFNGVENEDDIGFIEVMKRNTSDLEDDPRNRAKQIDPFEFKDILYSSSEIEQDHNEAVKIVREKQKYEKKQFVVTDLPYERRIFNEGYRKLLSDSMEASICAMSNVYKWFGEECAGQRTSNADDIISKADMILEVPALDQKNIKVNKLFAGVKIDVTTAKTIEVRAKIDEGVKRLKDYIQRPGDKTAERRISVLYYIDNNGNKMKIEPVIPLVLSVDFYEAEKFNRLINISLESPIKSMEASLSYELLAAHPLKKNLVRQIVDQLKMLMENFPSAAKEGRGFSKEAEQIGLRIEMLYEFFCSVQSKQRVYDTEKMK